MNRQTQQNCVEHSVLPANVCPGRRAGRDAAAGMGAREVGEEGAGDVLHWDDGSGC